MKQKSSKLIDSKTSRLIETILKWTITESMGARMCSSEKILLEEWNEFMEEQIIQPLSIR